MKTETMTPQALKNARLIADGLNADGDSTVHRLLGHIAALEAERDEALKRAKLTAGAHVEAVQRSEFNEDAVKACRERVDELKAAHAEEIERWQDASGLECGGDPGGVTPEGLAKYREELERELDARRQEVQTLDKHWLTKFAAETARAEHDKARAMAAEHEVETLTARMRTLEEMNTEEQRKRGLAETAVARSLQVAKAAEARLSGILQRAGDVAGFFRASGGVGTAGWLERGLAWVMGEDATGAESPDATGEADQPPAETTVTLTGAPQTDDLAAVEQWRENQAAKAFATEEVVEQLPGLIDSGVLTLSEQNDGRHLLTLLEGRMGAMRRAIHAFLHRPHEHATIEDEERLASVLTNAPEREVCSRCGDTRAVHTGVLDKDRTEACCAVDEQGQVCLCPGFLTAPEGCP